MKDCPYHGPDCDGVVYGRPSNPMDAMWQTHRMGGCVMDLAIPAVRANAIRSGLVWSGPSGAVDAALGRMVAAAQADENTVPAMLDAARAEATLGEICNAFKPMWGEYRETARF